MSITIDKAEREITEINNSLHKLSEEKKSKTDEIDGNADLTTTAKNRKIRDVEQKYSKAYGELVDQKKSIVTDTNQVLAESMYSGDTLSNPIAFDNAVNTFTKAEKQQELINRLKQNPSSETKRAIYKAATLGDYPSFDVLSEAAEMYPADKSSIENYFEWQQKYGKLEDRTQKLDRALGIKAV